MNETDIIRLGLEPGERVRLVTAAGDDIHREVNGLKVTVYNLPAGSCAAYYPECNALIPLWHHAERAKVPAAKSIPVRIERMTLTDRMMEAREGHTSPNAVNETPDAPAWKSDLPAGAQVAAWMVEDVVRRQPLRSLSAGLLTGVALAWAARRRR